MYGHSEQGTTQPLSNASLENHFTQPRFAELLGATTPPQANSGPRKALPNSRRPQQPAARSPCAWTHTWSAGARTRRPSLRHSRVQGHRVMRRSVAGGAATTGIATGTGTGIRTGGGPGTGIGAGTTGGMQSGTGTGIGVGAQTSGAAAAAAGGAVRWHRAALCPWRRRSNRTPGSRCSSRRAMHVGPGTGWTTTGARQFRLVRSRRVSVGPEQQVQQPGMARSQGPPVGVMPRMWSTPRSGAQRMGRAAAAAPRRRSRLRSGDTRATAQPQGRGRGRRRGRLLVSPRQGARLAPGGSRGRMANVGVPRAVLLRVPAAGAWAALGRSSSPGRALPHTAHRGPLAPGRCR